MKNKIIKILPWIYLAIIFIFSMVFFINNVGHLMDSDESSELILGQLLAKEHGILSTNWYYSTELRFINNQIVFAILFLFTSSYKLVRILSTIILCLIVLASFYYLCRQAGIQKYFPFMASFLVAPFSIDYAEYILYGLYYVPHMVLSFMIIGLILKTEKLEKSKYYIYVAITAILSLLAGMGGPRQVVILFAPVLVTLLLRLYIRRKLEYVAGWVAVVAGVIGYGLNTTVLSKIYTFTSWDSMEFQGFSISRISDIIEGLINTVGFSYGPVFSYSLIINGIVVVYIILLVIYYINICKNKDKISDTEGFMSLFFVMALVVFILLYDMTTMDYKNRYALPILVFALPLIGFSLEHHGWKEKSIIVGCIASLVINVAMAIPVYQAEELTETTWSLRGIAEYLEENDYQYGYATYWNANILTELTDGKVEMVNIGESGFEADDITDIHEWLQLKSHKDNIPEGPVFLVMGDGELEESTFALYINKENATYIYGDLNIWVYDSFEDMVKMLSTYEMDMYSNDYIISGYAEDGRWILPEGGLTRGPYTTVYEGVYRVTITGDNLNDCVVEATADLGKEPIKLLEENVDSNMRTYILEVEHTLHFFEAPIANLGSSEAVITSIKVERL